jgi:hypothetical protein
MDLTIAVLTGKRPELLAATLAALELNQPELYAAAAKVVIHNTGDRETAEVLDRYVWDQRVVLKGALRGIAEASQYLIKAAAEVDRRHVLRLEDDWLVSSRPFYAEAAELLEDPELNVGQIRLRDASETVMTKHRITKKPMVWRELDSGHQWAPSAHYTHNPSLMRTWDYAAMAGYTDEIDAARRYLEAGWSSVQHVPGAFAHAGDRDRGLSLKWSVGAP